MEDARNAQETANLVEDAWRWAVMRVGMEPDPELHMADEGKLYRHHLKEAYGYWASSSIRKAFMEIQVILVNCMEDEHTKGAYRLASFIHAEVMAGKPAFPGDRGYEEPDPEDVRAWEKLSEEEAVRMIQERTAPYETGFHAGAVRALRKAALESIAKEATVAALAIDLTGEEGAAAVTAIDLTGAAGVEMIDLTGGAKRMKGEAAAEGTGYSLLPRRPMVELEKLNPASSVPAPDQEPAPAAVTEAQVTEAQVTETQVTETEKTT